MRSDKNHSIRAQIQHRIALDVNMFAKLQSHASKLKHKPVAKQTVLGITI